MPDANGVLFNVVPAVPLSPLLPNLPDSPMSVKEVDPSEHMEPTPLDLLSRFLVYPPENRLKAAQALSHPWFGNVIFLPENLAADSTYAPKGGILQTEGKSLGSKAASLEAYISGYR